jgi:phosphoglycerol geranylgeranyltransferase
VKNNIQKHLKTKKKSIALLVDPDKTTELVELSGKINQSTVDYLFVGGSTANRTELIKTINLLKTHCRIPIIIFPGSPDQVSDLADAILFLCLISGRNPYYLIESQIEAAEEIINSSLECIPTSYILIDGKSKSSVVKVSKTNPIPPKNIDLIYKTALAGMLLGHSVTYLEAGSGAKQCIPVEIIKKISELDTTLIVGGGIKTISQIEEYHKAGADLVVIGNHIENNPQFLDQITQYKQHLA